MNGHERRVYDAAPQMLEALELVASELEGSCVTVNDTRPRNRKPSSMMGKVIAAIEAAKETKPKGEREPKSWWEILDEEEGGEG